MTKRGVQESTARYWFTVGFSALTVLLLCSILIASAMGYQFNGMAAIVLYVLISFSIAFTFALLGIKAALEGQLPIPLVDSHPVKVSVTGGAVLFILFLNMFYWWSEKISLAPNFADHPIKDIVAGVPLGSCAAEPTGSSFQRFEKGSLVIRFANSTIYAISEDPQSQTLRWRAVPDTFRGRAAECPEETSEYQSLLVRGFRSAYCENAELRDILGRPIERENRAWIQFQEFSDGLLIHGIPTVLKNNSRDVWLTVQGAFLNELPNRSGVGNYRLIGSATIPDYVCSAFFHHARDGGKRNWPPRFLENECETASSASRLTKPKPRCSVDGF